MNRAFVLGLFVLCGLGLFAAGLFIIGNRHQTFAKHVEFRSEFANLSEIAKGAKVEVAGMDAGQVTTVLVPDSPSSKFRITMRIDEKLHGLVRTDSVVTVATEGVVGDKFLVISAGGAQAPIAPPNAMLASKEPLELSALLEQAKGALADIDTTVRNADTAVSTAKVLLASVGGNLNSTLITAKTTLVNANDVIAGVKRGEGTAGMLLRDPALAEQVRLSVDNARKAVADVQKAAENTNAIVADVRSREFPRKIDETMGQARNTVSNLDATSQNVREAVAQFTAPDEKGVPAAVNLRESVSSIHTAAGNIADDSEALKHNFLLRGYFKKRGYYNLSHLAPDQYRKERIFTAGGNHRVWLSAGELFHRDANGVETVTPAGRALLEQALSRYGTEVLGSEIVIEGYSNDPNPSARMMCSQARSLAVRNQLQRIFQLDPNTIGSVALENTPPNGAGHAGWEGVAILVVQPK